MTCSKLYVTKIKFSKSLQSQRNKDEIKTSFNFTVILCKYVSKKWNLILHPTLSYNQAQESNNKLQFIGIFHSLSFLLLFIYVHSLILAPVLIQVAHAIHKHMQFKMIGKQLHGNDCSSQCSQGNLRKISNLCVLAWYSYKHRCS